MNKKTKTYIQRFNGDYKSDAEIIYDIETNTIVFNNKDLGNQIWHGIDLLDSFNKMREFIEYNGYLIFVNGARKNTWASGYLRDSSNGLLTYILDDIEPKKIVNIFDYYPNDIVIMKEHREFYNNWRERKK